MFYALFDAGEMKIRPSVYSRYYFLEYKQDLELPYSYSAPDILHLSDTIYLLPFTDPPIPKHNAITEQLSGPYWDETTVPGTGSYNVVDTPLEQAKNSAKQRVANNRFEREDQRITININDVDIAFNTSRENRVKLVTQYNIMLDNDLIDWKYNNTWVQISKPQLLTVLSQINASIQTLFQWERDTVLLINAATNKEELESIDLGNVVPPTFI